MQESEQPVYSSLEQFQQEMAKQAGLTSEQFKKYNVVLEVSSELNKESDRGCCLMAAAFLEHELQELIKSKLVGTKKFHDTLFEFNGPLGTFSSKIKMAFAVGIIGSQELNDLEIIRKIRNDFGHKHQPINFESSELKARIDNIHNSLYDKGQAKCRAVFINTVLSLLGTLHGSMVSIKKFEEKQSHIVSIERKRELVAMSIKIATDINDASNNKED